MFGVPIILLTFLFATLSLASSEEDSTWTQISARNNNVTFDWHQNNLELKIFIKEDYRNDVNVFFNKGVQEYRVLMGLLNGVPNGIIKFSTIKMLTGHDVLFSNCLRYRPYLRPPCPGTLTQIWSWDIRPDMVIARCNGELVFKESFQEIGMQTKAPVCSLTWKRAQINSIAFLQMTGEYYRAVEKTTAPTTTPAPSTSLTKRTTEKRQCGNCWTPECNYCRNPECLIKYQLSNSSNSVAIESPLNWKSYNQVALVDSNGRYVGALRWNMKGFHLDGCVACGRSGPIKRDKGKPTRWFFEICFGVLRISVRYKKEKIIILEKPLTKTCKERYKDVTHFAFMRQQCSCKFDYYPEEMQMGKLIENYSSLDSCKQDQA